MIILSIVSFLFGFIVGILIKPKERDGTDTKFVRVGDSVYRVTKEK